MLVGLPPFYSRNRETMFEKIMRADLHFPNYVSEVDYLVEVYYALIMMCRERKTFSAGF